MQYHALPLAFLLPLGGACHGEANVESNRDAAPVVTIDAKAARPLPTAPLTGTHLDGDEGYQPSEYRPSTTLRKRTAKPIELILRSTPPGAIASVDGKPIGTTPTFWEGKADGQAHEYTFTKPGYSMARYRFVATQSGVVHGSMSVLVKAQAK